VPLGALALGDHLRLPGWAIERWDCNALTLGPWSVVIRDSDGHFASKGAVVIYPFPGLPGQLDTPVATPQGGKWNAESRSLIWPINEGYNAKIVGDLGQTRLADLATRITVQQGRPHLSPVDGLGATTTTTTTCRPPAVHELSYQSVDLGQETTNPYPPLDSFAAGQNSGALVWESAPDEVTSIGYDGSATEKEAIEVLRALADKGAALSPAQWLSRDRAPVG
jgi:hypothetical protein